MLWFLNDLIKLFIVKNNRIDDALSASCARLMQGLAQSHVCGIDKAPKRMLSYFLLRQYKILKNVGNGDVFNFTSGNIYF
jgi:hypothetical protein